jgi:hypothetical protein
MVATASTNDTQHTRRPWTPDGNDHLIFQWVKMEGKTQDWVATQLEISQATVSRVVQRYERWQAHAREREGGRLDHSERLRAQRWLTFERNELLLSSCLRIAQEMEGFTDVSKSTIRRAAGNSREGEVSTQHATIDRSGVAARFLRLAFRINMEQLKLAELDPPPLAAPLSAEEIAEQDREAAAAAEEIAEAQRREGQPSGEDSRPLLPEGILNRQAAHCAERPCAPSDPIPETGSARQAEPTNGQANSRPLLPEGTLNRQAAHCAERPCAPSDAIQETGSARQAEPTNGQDEPAAAPASLHNVHNLHDAQTAEIAVTHAEPCGCLSQPCSDKNSSPLHTRP